MNLGNIFATAAKKIGGGIKTGAKKIASLGDEDVPVKPVKVDAPPRGPKLEPVVDAPPPKRQPRRIEAGNEAPISELEQLPELPTRAPLTKEQRSGFKNRAFGFLQGMADAKMRGADAVGVIAGGVGGAVNRENADRRLWEQNVELPAVERRQRAEGEILRRREAYRKDRDVETREQNAKTAEERARVTEENNKRTVQAAMDRLNAEIKAREAANEDTRAHKEKLLKLEQDFKVAQAKLDNFEKMNRAKVIAGAAKDRLVTQEAGRDRRKRAELIADAPPDYEPSDAEVAEELRFMPAGTKEQARAELKSRQARKAKKPGAAKAAETLNWNQIR